MICVNDLSVGTRLLPLSFKVEKGEILHIIGPNGSGKSTLLAAMSGLLECDGTIHLQDEDVAKLSLDALSTKRAYLSQQARPAFALNVHHFLSLSVPAMVDQKAVAEAVSEICVRLKVEDKLERSVNELSGGEWQRVRLAALCIQIWPTLNPYGQLLILDEPAAPLDVGQESMMYELVQQVAQLGLSVVMANHDLNRTLRHADKVLLLDKGVVRGYGSSEQVLTPDLLSDVYQTKVEKLDSDKRSYLLFG